MTMQLNSTNNYLKNIMFLYLALLIGQILFMGMLMFITLSDSNVASDQEIQKIFMYIVPAVAIAGAAAGHLLFKNRIEKIKTMSSLSARLIAYRTALITGCALLEGPFFLAFIAFFLTTSYIFPVIGIFLLGIFLMLRPTKDKIINDLDLNPEESKELETLEISNY